MNNEIYTETEGLVGIRFEYKPSFIPGLNIGFVLNQPDQIIMKAPNEQTFAELLQESVIGIAYKHDYFAVNVGYRFDSEVDKYKINNKNEGGRLAYRIEESFLKNLVPGLQIWLNGYYYGLGCEQFDVPRAGTSIIDKMGGGERIFFKRQASYIQTPFLFSVFRLGGTYFHARCFPSPVAQKGKKASGRAANIQKTPFFKIVKT